MNIASRIALNDGIQIPIFGLGVYLNASGPACVDTIKYALSVGYRHIDTAEFYGNESSVGEAVVASGLPREDVFVTSKLWNTEVGRSGAVASCTDALKRYDAGYGHHNSFDAFFTALAPIRLLSAKIGYFDLYLIHAPQGGRVKECYEALLDLKSKGLVKSVGVSNFGIEHLKALKSHGLPAPSCNQIELHPWQQKRDIVDYCRQQGIALTAYSPLTKGQRINDPTVSKIATQIGRTNAQVLIRWALQSNFITIPKSVNKQRILENGQVFDWSLSESDMQILNELGNKPWSCTWDPTRNSLKEAGL